MGTLFSWGEETERWTEAEVLRRIDETSRQLALLAQAAIMMESATCESQVDDASEVSRLIAGRVWNIRALRKRIFNAELFGEPAWDMLLEMYALETSDQRESVSGICYASGVPMTTALRHLQKLEAEGLVEETVDGRDHRRKHVALTSKARAALDDLFKHVRFMSQ